MHYSFILSADLIVISVRLWNFKNGGSQKQEFCWWMTLNDRWKKSFDSWPKILLFRTQYLWNSTTALILVFILFDINLGTGVIEKHNEIVFAALFLGTLICTWYLLRSWLLSILLHQFPGIFVTFVGKSIQSFFAALYVRNVTPGIC